MHIPSFPDGRQGKDVVDGCQADQRIYDSAYQAHRAEQGCYQVKFKEAYKPLIQGADKQQGISNDIDYFQL